MIEAFEREFAPWALKLPAADVAARRSGQLRANGWSVLYDFGSDAYGEYLDYYAALRGATDARVNDDWHARIYATGQVVAFPAVLEAYLYGRDPSADELQRARAPVLASLEPPAAESDAAAIGTADTALWEDLKDVVEEQIPPEPVAPQPVAPQPVTPEPVAPEPVAPKPAVPPPAASAPPPRVSVPVRRSAETPAEIANVLDAAFGGAKEVPAKEVPTKEVPAKEPPAEQAQAEEAQAEEAPVEEAEPKVEEAEPEIIEAPAPRRSASGYDPFIEFRTLEPKSMRRAAPTDDDFRPYWQRYPLRTAGIAGGIAAVVLIAFLAMGHKSSAKPARTLADTAAAADPTAATGTGSDTTAPAPAAQADTQTLAPDTADTASAPASAPAATPVSSQSEDNSVARPLGPNSVPQIKRAP